jgi:predicted dehydrogenase
MKEKHILIIGSGSIGKRHARNLAALGCKISCVDPRPERCEELALETPVARYYATIDEALLIGNYSGVVVGSPTFYHPEHTIKAMRAGLPVLLEKPVAISLKEAKSVTEVMNQTNGSVLLGYTWRWWTPLRRVKDLLNEDRVGTLRHVQFHMSAHLADWHPWEPYQDFFMSKKELGGGALLDESHWIDLMIWFFGDPDKVSGKVARLSDLEIETDDNVDALCCYKGFNVSLHLDLYGRPHEKFIRFIGEKGTILWSASPNKIMIGVGSEQEWVEEKFDCERNEMFVETAREFLDIVDGKKTMTCTLSDGLNVMKVIEAIRFSSSESRMISIDDIQKIK